MTAEARILVLDDEEDWRTQLIPEFFEDWPPAVSFELTKSVDEAIAAIRARAFDLAIVDLNLLGVPPDLGEQMAPEGMDETGIDFLQPLQNNPKQSGCGVLVLSGYLKNPKTTRLLSRHGVSDWLDKESSDKEVQRAAERAICEARARSARRSRREGPVVHLHLGATSVRSASLRAGESRSTYRPSKPVSMPWNDCAVLADAVEGVAGGSRTSGAWREPARLATRSLESVLARDGGVLQVLQTAKSLADEGRCVTLRCSSPASVFGAPWELLKIGSQGREQCLEGPVSRRVERKGHQTFHNTESTGAFLHRLQQDRQSLRVLLVAANSDGRIPVVEEEVEALADQLRSDFRCVGISVDTELLTGTDASFQKVRAALHDGGFHWFHYAGHGEYESALPEQGGFLLRDGDGTRRLTAADLELLVGRSGLRMLVASCCVGARSSAETGRGHRYGLVDALAGVDVPVVMAHRWPVWDRSAKSLALELYHRLSRTFCPEQALFEARTHCAVEHTLDDPTWASPVLLLQHDW